MLLAALGFLPFGDFNRPASPPRVDGMKQSLTAFSDALSPAAQPSGDAETALAGRWTETETGPLAAQTLPTRSTSSNTAYILQTVVAATGSAKHTWVPHPEGTNMPTYVGRMYHLLHMGVDKVQVRMG